MAKTLQDAMELIRSYRRQNPHVSKSAVAEAVAKSLGLTKHRTVYACDDYSMRFSEASGRSFSNAVLGLRQLQKFDYKPFVVVICRPAATEFLLANTTMLKKISHSSHHLRVDHVRGSFLGHDIIREYDGISNTPENFDRLFACHQQLTWSENLERLVEATNAIAGIGKRFEPTNAEREMILASPVLAADLVSRESYRHLKRELARVVREQSQEILEHARAHPTNVNLRGNYIEQAITGGINKHDLGDMIRRLDHELSLEIEIKTKLMDRAGSPKAYNVDKALRVLARPNALIVFCFVGIDLASAEVTSSTVSIFDEAALSATKVQFHWAGRNSRGVTQLTGNLRPLFSANYREQVNVDRAVAFLNQLLSL